jgi:hypothetical protein
LANDEDADPRWGRLLESFGVTVKTAPDGAAALRAILERWPDLVSTISACQTSTGSSSSASFGPIHGSAESRSSLSSRFVENADLQRELGARLGVSRR